MIRLTRKGGARLRSLVRSSMLGLLLPVAAIAADAGFTDRIIVKYRTTPASSLAQATQLRGVEMSAQRFGVTMNRVRTTALGSEVLRIDRRMSLAEAARLAAGTRLLRGAGCAGGGRT